ncbi:hypothetical protein F2Q69_00021993 [Brassica cretica]|uniref:Aspartic peptidase DDI1-type domain-containing protein n=1 Tax=Brassica cretica TaxID=69181 RepID=A0A8S9QML8_BRACR|nr:hypothetical protein F2Q69_00021993 [Brassica cretica]
MDSFTKRVLRIPLDKPFEEAYFTHRLWMFLRETKETEQDIHRIFDQIRYRMKQRITLKKNDPGKFAVPYLVKGIEFPCAMCDTGSSVRILPKVMSEHLGMKIEPSQDSFTFVDHSTRNSGGIIRDLEVQIGNALVLVDFHVLENKQNKNHSLLLGRAFMDTVGAVCNMQTNQLCLTLINPDVHYYPDKYETEYSGSIDSWAPSSINRDIHPPIDNTSIKSIDSSPANETFTLPSHCYPCFDVATQPQTAIDYYYGDSINRQGNYTIGSWADDSLHESYAVETDLPETRTDEYDEDYHREKSIEYHSLAMDDIGFLPASFTDAMLPSINSNNRLSIDDHQKPNLEEDIADIIAMNGSINFFNSKKRSEDPLSIDYGATTSIDGQFESSQSTLHLNRKQKRRWESRDEYGVYKVEDGFAHDEDGRIIHVSKEDIRAILQRAAMVGHICIGLPEYAKVPIPTVPAQNSYIKVEIDDLVDGIYRVIRTSDDFHSKRLDDIYYPSDNNISWLTTHTDEMEQDIAILQKQHGVDAGRSTSIGAHTKTSIDAIIQESIDARLAPFEARLQSFTYRLDGVYYGKSANSYINRGPRSRSVHTLSTCANSYMNT